MSLASQVNALASRVATECKSIRAAIATREPAITAGTTGQYWRGDKSWQTLGRGSVSLGNVDNTSDVNKPVSTAQAAAIATKEPVIAAGTTAQYWRGDKSWQALSLADMPTTSLKLPCRVVTAPYTLSVGYSPTHNTALSGLQTIDGVTLAVGDRVLVVDQIVNASNNGIWIAASGAWTRAIDGDSTAKVNNALVPVTSGTIGAGSLWSCGVASGAQYWAFLARSDELYALLADTGWYQPLYSAGSGTGWTNATVGFVSVRKIGKAVHVRLSVANGTDLTFSSTNGDISNQTILTLTSASYLPDVAVNGAGRWSDSPITVNLASNGAVIITGAFGRTYSAGSNVIADFHYFAP